MKKLTNLLIVVSLALAGAVMAQQPTPEESKAPGKKPDKKVPAVKEPAAPKSDAPAAKEPAAKKPDAPAMKEPAATKPETPAVKEPAAPKADKKAPKTAPPAAAETKPSGDQPATSATTPASKTERPSKKDMKKEKAPAADASASASPAAAKTTPAASVAPKATTTPAVAATTTPAAAATTTPAAAATTTPAAATATTTPAAATASATPAAAASASAAPSVAQTTTTKEVKKPEPQKIEQIKQRHATFRAQARPDRAPAVSFSANFRLPGVERWQGPRYEVYRSYRPERHDQTWYRSRYQRVELIAGGYYYFHNNYWYPAWGYSPREEYYAYDAPIYVGRNAEPPDKVIANVQAVLQEMGYYKGEVDGLLGPLTREALTGYQTDNGMTVTAVIDEPTLDALGMG